MLKRDMAMKRKVRKTYGVRGLIEWKMALRVDSRTCVRVNFTGGSMGSNGVVPAKYTTDNPVVQHLIENSVHFRTRRIILCSSADGE